MSVELVHQLLESAIARGGDHPAVIDAADGRVSTWREVGDAVAAQRQRLLDAGLGAGDRVLLRLPTATSGCIAAFAVWQAGGVVVPVPPGLSEPAVHAAAAESGARLLWHVLDDVIEDMPVESPLESGTADLGEQIAMLAHTPAADGSARLAMLTHRALLAGTGIVGTPRPAPVTPADRVLAALPFSHRLGMQVLLQVVTAGATVVALRPGESGTVPQAVRAQRVTVVIGPPSLYRRMLRETPAQQLWDDFETVRLALSGSAPLQPELAVALRSAIGLRVHDAYGLTEAGPMLTSTLTGGREAGSVGAPLPGVSLRLVDADGEPLTGEDADGTGTVQLSARSLFSGYWPDGAEGPDAQGWWSTGDTGHLGAQGELHVLDRVQDLITVHGFTVYPHEVESVLLEHPMVARAAVVGGDETDQAVQAVVVPASDAPASDAPPVEDPELQQRLLQHCAERLAAFKVPASIRLVAELPEAGSGEVMRRALRAGAGEVQRDARPRGAEDSDDDLF